ncbi:MAG: hypothetical protein FWD58_04790 [Firmicutes bacterium]|nr:hypothetical protein [Bacillota bacterium]
MTNFLAYNGITGMSADVTFTVLFALITALVMLPAIWLLTKFIKKPKYAVTYAEQSAAFAAGEQKVAPVKFSFGGILAAIIGVGLIVRLLFSFFITGYRVEFSGLFGIFGSDPTSYFTKSSDAIIHYPLIIYLFSFFGLFAQGFGIGADAFAAPVLVKLPMILADMGLIYLCYHAAKKYINEYTALVLAGFVAVFPPLVFASSVWGSVYSILAVFLALTFYFMVSKNYAGMFVAYAFALLTAKDALYLFPVVAIFVIYQFIKTLRYISTNNIKGFKAVMADKNARSAVLLPTYVLAAWLGMWLLSLPLVYNYSASPFRFTYMLYFYPLAPDLSTVTQYYGFNALNVYNLFFNNGVALGSGFPGVFFAIAFAVLISLLVGVVYLSRKNRANLVYLAAYILLTLSIFYVDFGAMNLIAVLPLLLIALVFIRDRRILTLTVVLGLAVVLNGSFVMMHAGYISSAPEADFIAGYTLESVRLFKETGWLAANYVMSIIVILAEIYATIIILDIAMSNKRKLFADLPKSTFGKSLLKFLKD